MIISYKIFVALFCERVVALKNNIQRYDNSKLIIRTLLCFIQIYYAIISINELVSSRTFLWSQDICRYVSLLHKIVWNRKRVT